MKHERSMVTRSTFLFPVPMRFRRGSNMGSKAKPSKFSACYRQKRTHCVTTGIGELDTSPGALTGASEAGADRRTYILPNPRVD